jgi:hypothetical protein
LALGADLPAGVASNRNPETRSGWAKMAREGKKAMQFLDAGRYVAVVVDGKMKTYG